MTMDFFYWLVLLRDLLGALGWTWEGGLLFTEAFFACDVGLARALGCGEVLVNGLVLRGWFLWANGGEMRAWMIVI